MEICLGCGVEADGEHPIVCVLHQDDLAKGNKKLGAKKVTAIPNPEPESPFVGAPTCAACHLDPEHRTKNPLKGHFFIRGVDRITVALVMAGGPGGVVAGGATDPRLEGRPLLSLRGDQAPGQKTKIGKTQLDTPSIAITHPELAAKAKGKKKAKD